MAKQPLSDPIPLRLPLDVLAEIEKIAEASDRTRSWVMVRALRLYLASEGADILSVVKGREAIAAGDHHDMNDVLAEIEEIVRGKVA
jgi:predicted transcriptional regulator